jgi:hypothetical protein
VAVGTTVTVLLVDCVPVNVPPMVLEVDAVQEVALVDDHVSVTSRPKLIVDVPCVGAVNVTVGMAAGGGVGGGIIGEL